MQCFSLLLLDIILITKVLSLFQMFKDVTVFCWQDMVQRRGYEQVNLLSTDLTEEMWLKLM